MAKRRKTVILRAMGRIGAHKRIRESCVTCPKRGHDHIKKGSKDLGNYHRFHGHGSFCRTHRTTKIGRQYCKRR